MSATHRFHVPARIGRVWAAVNTPELIASCLPGASVTTSEDGDLSGTLKVKLGARTLTYAWTGRLEERHLGGRHTVLTAEGVDGRGQGTARVKVKTSVTEEGDRTLVDVTCDTTLTGPSAQLPEDAVEEAVGRLVAQLAEELSARFAAGLDPAELNTDVAQSDYDLFVRLAPVWAQRGAPPVLGSLGILWVVRRFRRRSARRAARAVGRAE